ncbi:MAG TPA: multidrug effflux MFS transporter [Salinarimonas sp.]|nr:multidrug effflux MFS transporter [Salinarimonas sp.]
MSFREFVGMVAGLMALNALAIDIMLPSLQQIGAALAVQDENSRQAVLSAYLVGFGAGQLLIGSVSDRYGRRSVLIAGLAVYVAAALLCAAAPSFQALLLGRLVQGLASAAPRVVTTSVVRDCYGGRRMASVMSLAMTVFMAVPVLAPSIGQAITLFASWRAIFGFLTVYGVVMLVWVAWRLPETLSPEDRRPVTPRGVLAAYAEVLGTRRTLGYALAGGTVFGAMFGFLTSAQQVFTEVFRIGPYFPLAFAGVALAMSASSFLNARLVGRYGMRRLSHGAVTAFALLSAAMAGLAWTGHLAFVPFMMLLAGLMFLVGMVFSNFNALAMEPQGHVAGTAASAIGSVSTLVGATVGSGIGQAYDGTLVPMATGYLLLSLVTLAIVAVTERGRLY